MEVESDQIDFLVFPEDQSCSASITDRERGRASSGCYVCHRRRNRFLPITRNRHPQLIRAVLLRSHKASLPACRRDYGRSPPQPRSESGVNGGIADRWTTTTLIETPAGALGSPEDDGSRRSGRCSAYSMPYRRLNDGRICVAIRATSRGRPRTLLLWEV